MSVAESFAGILSSGLVANRLGQEIKYSKINYKALSLEPTKVYIIPHSVAEVLNKKFNPLIRDQSLRVSPCSIEMSDHVYRRGPAESSKLKMSNKVEVAFLNMLNKNPDQGRTITENQIRINLMISSIFNPLIPLDTISFCLQLCERKCRILQSPKEMSLDSSSMLLQAALYLSAFHSISEISVESVATNKVSLFLAHGFSFEKNKYKDKDGYSSQEIDQLAGQPMYHDLCDGNLIREKAFFKSVNNYLTKPRPLSGICKKRAFKEECMRKFVLFSDESLNALEVLTVMRELGKSTIKVPQDITYKEKVILGRLRRYYDFKEQYKNLRERFQECKNRSITNSNALVEKNIEDGERIATLTGEGLAEITRKGLNASRMHLQQFELCIISNEQLQGVFHFDEEETRVRKHSEIEEVTAMAEPSFKKQKN